MNYSFPDNVCIKPKNLRKKKEIEANYISSIGKRIGNEKSHNLFENIVKSWSSSKKNMSYYNACVIYNLLYYDIPQYLKKEEKKKNKNEKYCNSDKTPKRIPKRKKKRKLSYELRDKFINNMNKKKKSSYIINNFYRLHKIC